MKQRRDGNGAPSGRRLEPAPPLWQRVPTRGPAGEALNDFMMLIPGLRDWPEARRQETMAALERALEEQAGRLVFVDLNLGLNLLWISMRPDPEGCLGVAAAIKARVPEAVLVASRAELLVGAQRRRRRGLAALFRRRLPTP